MNMKTYNICIAIMATVLFGAAIYMACSEKSWGWFLFLGLIVTACLESVRK